MQWTTTLSVNKIKNKKMQGRLPLQESWLHILYLKKESACIFPEF